MARHYLLISATNEATPEIAVLAASLERVDPEASRSIVVVDQDPEALELLSARGEVKTGSDMGLDLDLVGRWIGAYGERGLVWAAFPHILRQIGEPGDHVLWIGSDVAVARAPTLVWDALEEHEVIAALAAPSLSPHVTDDDNELQPVSVVVRQSGELVSRSLLGWRAGSENLENLLSEWPVPCDRLPREALANVAAAQVWFNSLALRDEVEVVKSGGLVLSAAQLLSKTVESGPNETSPLVDGEPVILLSLRGFDPREPHLLESDTVIVRVSDRPALAPALNQHAAALIAAGSPRVSRWGMLPEGLPNSGVVQDLVRKGIRSGAITRSPFSEDGFEQLRAYLLEPAVRGGALGVNRLLEAIYDSRPDVRAAFPSLEGNGGLPFIAWAWKFGRKEMAIPESFLPPPPAKAAAAKRRRRKPDSEGVNLAGYFTSELGLGESARQLAGALEAAGVPTTPVQGLFVPPTRQQAEFSPVSPKEACHDVNIVVINGDQMQTFAHDVGERFFAGRPTIGVWWWEVDPFPVAEWSPALRWLDEVWVGSDFIKSLIEPHIDVPVWVFPAPVSIQRLEKPLTRAHFGWKDDETVFLYIWDYHSTEARKNPSGLVEAYRRAFEEGSKTRLVLKCINHQNLPKSAEKVRLAAAGRSDIQIIDRFLSGREKNALLELCDCYVSPHRSEGFGYTPAEAMLLGKPVIATGYGGTTQYADETVARIVKWTPCQVGQGSLPYPYYGHWADPDLDDLAAAMRWIVEEPRAVAAMAERGRRRVAERHDPKACGQAMQEHLALVRARFAAAPRVKESLFRRAVRRLLRNRLTGPPLRRIRRKLQSMMDNAVSVRTASIEQRVDYLQSRVDGAERSSDRLARRLDPLDIRVDTLQHREDEVEQHLSAVEQLQADHFERHAAEPYGTAEAGLRVEEVEGIGRALGASDLHGSGDRYADFLSVFRGPYERVLELMQPYGALLAGQGPLLDIGCGRGELLEIAEREGIEARGVDLDKGLVEQAVALGRKATVAEGVETLRATPENSIGSVCAIHVIEHLSFDELLELLTQALRALCPGGMLLTETINPHEVSAASTFWVDPTHRAPIFPEVLVATVLANGFVSAYVFAPDGTGDWEHDRKHSTRYALVARKAG